MLTPEEQILSAFQQGKISGSWMITGPYGVGKKRFARRLCSYLMTGNWDQELSFHPDIKWIERSLTEEEKKETVKAILAGKAVPEKEESRARKKEITVDDIREALKFLSLKSSSSHLRVLVISLADDMNENAANALLKMLEEPTFQTVILLLCQNTGKLLPTIRSRCRKITLRPLSFDQMVDLIKKHMPSCKNVELIAHLCEGSLGLAQDIEENNGIELYQKMLSFCVPVSKLDIEKLNAFCDSFYKDEKGYFLLKTFLLNFVYKQVQSYCSSNPILCEKWMDLYGEMTRSFIQIDGLYLDKRQCLMNLFFKMAEVIK